MMTVGLYSNVLAFEYKHFQKLTIDSKIKVFSSKDTYSDLHLLKQIHPTNDFQINFDFLIIEQYRKPKPNPWETLWLFWSYLPSGDGFKKTNYMALKTNGIEMGKAFNSHDQIFLWTQNNPKILLDKWNSFSFIKNKAFIEIVINGKQLQIDQLKDLYNHPGRLGLYTEDAKVKIKNINYNF